MGALTRGLIPYFNTEEYTIGLWGHVKELSIADKYRGVNPRLRRTPTDFFLLLLCSCHTIQNLILINKENAPHEAGRGLQIGKPFFDVQITRCILD